MEQFVTGKSILFTYVLCGYPTDVHMHTCFCVAVKCLISTQIKVNSGPAYWMFIFFFLFFANVFTLVCLHVPDFILIQAYVFYLQPLTG